MVLARGQKTGTLYMTSGSSDMIAIDESKNTAELWHRRFGHVSQKGMKVLLSKGKLPELNSIDLDMCENCILGKQKKSQFLEGGWSTKVKKVGICTHGIGGPSPISSLGGFRYHFTFYR